MNQMILHQYGLGRGMNAFQIEANQRLARVLSLERELYRVITEEGEFFAKLSGKFYYETHSALDFPTVGDWVSVETESNFAIIQQVFPRYSVFYRKAAGKTSAAQLIASNIDYLVICMSLNDNFNLRRLERYLASAWSSGAQPVLYLSKADQTENVEFWKQQAESIAIGVPILIGSDRLENGYQALDNFLKVEKTYAFVGSSGVGKSTLINHLLGQDSIETADTGSHDKGRHTTTGRHLYLTPTGSLVIDTPGMREFGLDEADFDLAFSDIETLAQNCKFSDCQHEMEPHCAVREAIELGELPLERLENYRKLIKEQAHQQRKAEQQAIQARRFAKRR